MMGPAIGSNTNRTAANVDSSNPAAPYPTPNDRANSGRIGAMMPNPRRLVNVISMTTRTAGSARIVRKPTFGGGGDRSGAAGVVTVRRCYRPAGAGHRYDGRPCHDATG